MIKAIFNGTLGRDATVNAAGETKVINFSVAVNVGYGDKKKTIWIDCSRFGDKVGVADFLKKGTRVLVEGEPDIRTYQTKDGNTAASFTLRVTELELLVGEKKGEQAQEPVTKQRPVKQAAPPLDADDNLGLPF